MAAHKIKVYGAVTEGRPLMRTISRAFKFIYDYDHVTFKRELYPVYWNGVDGYYIQLSHTGE